MNEQKVTPPIFPNSLIIEPTQSNPEPNIKGLGPLQYLIGTWTNQNLGSSERGGKLMPYSYNLLALPSIEAKEKYILKNFTYYEEITFSPINGNVQNRGGNYSQYSNVIFYEQRVYFAEGPYKDKLVHAENGSWLFLKIDEQPLNAYGATPVIPPPNPLPVQNKLATIAKQISVPHGNSILAIGNIKNYNNLQENSYINEGPLEIEDYQGSLPQDADSITPYRIKTSTQGGNPHPLFNTNPNRPLQQSTVDYPCTKYIEWSVDTENKAALGSVTNIPFEQKKADVSNYKAQYWLQSFNSENAYTQLAYSQTIILDIPINGKIVKFPHITCNVLTKKE
ncbi:MULTISPECIES: heme-binding protein [Flavobacterium]|uniref:Heme-binding protein n=1 Tax=Flavobacterium jumunjinense TaxID=998845 RepID=A0ABV5GTY8_9FLAO|nr:MULTISPECIES: heme-binding protein [Flavobacterium]